MYKYMSNFLKYTILSFLLLFITSKIYSKNLGNEGLVWMNYTNNLKINEKFNLISEIHERFFLNQFYNIKMPIVFKLHYKIGKDSNWDVSLQEWYFFTKYPSKTR
jgi:hypothetical protein